MKEFIYSGVKATVQSNLEVKSVSGLLREIIRDRRDDAEAEDFWTIDATDLTSQIFVLHIATDLVYYEDKNKFRIQSLGSSREIGKALSD